MAQGVPGRLRPRVFLTFGITRVVGRQPYVPAAFTPGEIPGTHFQRLSRPQGKWFCRWEPRKKTPVTPPGIDPGTARLVAQCLNHYATPGYNVFTSVQSAYVFQSLSTLERSTLSRGNSFSSNVKNRNSRNTCTCCGGGFICSLKSSVI